MFSLCRVFSNVQTCLQRSTATSVGLSFWACLGPIRRVQLETTLQVPDCYTRPDCIAKFSRGNYYHRQPCLITWQPATCMTTTSVRTGSQRYRRFSRFSIKCVPVRVVAAGCSQYATFRKDSIPYRIPRTSLAAAVPRRGALGVHCHPTGLEFGSGLGRSAGVEVPTLWCQLTRFSHLCGMRRKQGLIATLFPGLNLGITRALGQ